LHTYAPTLLAALVVLASLWSAATAAPHYRLYTNIFGGGQARAGYYFPQDEFYDAGLREALTAIAREAPRGARVANETPALAAYYLQQARRPDLVSVPLSDPQARAELRAGDFVINARGRRYHSNEALLNALHQTSAPVARISLGPTPAVEAFMLDEQIVSLIGASR
jgi:hypothetical protein